MTLIKWMLKRCLYVAKTHQRPGRANSDMCLRKDYKGITKWLLKVWLSKKVMMTLLSLLLTPFRA